MVRREQERCCDLTVLLVLEKWAGTEGRAFVTSAQAPVSHRYRHGLQWGDLGGQTFVHYLLALFHDKEHVPIKSCGIDL